MSSECGKNNSEVISSETSSQKFQANNENSHLKYTSLVSQNPSESEASGVYSSSQKDSCASSEIRFAHLNSEVFIEENAFTEVMQKMSSKHYNISEDQELLVYEKCKLLFEKDYICKVVSNCDYTMNYPISIIVPVKKKVEIEGPFMDFDSVLYSKLVEEGLELRRRKRFVTPAILFDNKFICRSAAPSVKLSTLQKTAAEMLPPCTVIHDKDAVDILRNYSIAFTLFKTDVDIMEYLKIERVIDLMTSNHFNKSCQVTKSFVTSEKTHEDLYKKVKIDDMPYMGANYFAYYHKAGRNVKDTLFDWVNEKRQLNLTEDPKIFFPEIDVGTDYKTWDMKKLTENYLKIILSQVLIDIGGMVIHCASGWDRTPLFISLLRLSLWADGLLHESLQFQDITYLTVAYDWFLFGHKFPVRHQENHDIMHFCFNFLEFIISDEFSLTRLFQELPAEKKRNRVFPEFVPGRRISLNKVRSLFLEIYDKEILKNKEL